MSTNNFVIDRVKRVLFNSEKNKFMLTQVKDFQLSMESDTEDAVDALGSPIKTFERAKSVKVSGNSAIFDLNLLAAQVGAEKQVGSSTSKILTPYIEIKTIDSNATVTTDKAPKSEIATVSILDDNSNYGENLKITTGSSPTTGQFTSAAASSPAGAKKLTFPADYKNKRVFIQYFYEADSGVAIEDKASATSAQGETIIEVLGADICDTETLVYAYFILPKSKLSYQNDITFATDLSQPFEISALADYCGAEDATLWKLVIPDKVTA